MLLFGNKLRANIVWGRGYTMLSQFAVVPFTMSLPKEWKKYKLEKVLSTLFVVLFGLLYSARTEIIYVIFGYFLVYVRKMCYRAKPKTNFGVLVVCLLILLFFLFSFAARRGADALFSTTPYLLQRSFYDLLDYFATTVIFTAYGFNDLSTSILTIKSQLGDSYIFGFTNDGRYYSIYSSLKGLTLAFIILESYYFAVSWKRYDEGYDSGIILFTIAAYSLLEGARLDPLSVVGFALPVLFILLLVSHKKDSISCVTH